MYPIKDQMFMPIKSPQVNKTEYENIDLLIKTCETFSRMNNQSIYVIDYVQQTFLYVSSHPLFLCGYTVEEVKELGYSFYEKVVSPQDLQMLLTVNQFGWDFFYTKPIEERSLSRVSYDFYLHHKDGQKILINHKLSVLSLTPNGNIWLGMCIVNYSTNKSSGNVIFSHSKGKDTYYKFDSESKKLEAYIPEKITAREEEILRLIIRGYSEEEIGQILTRSIHTVKNHRRNIEQKFGTNKLAHVITKFHSMF